MKYVRALLVVLLLATPSMAIAESLIQGIIDYTKAKINASFKNVLQLVLDYITSNPDLSNWPTFNAIHNSFMWLSGFFMLALTYQGIRYLMAADSPSGRANSKAALQRLIVGMIIVSFNGLIFNLGLDVSDGLTDAFIVDSLNDGADFELTLIAATFGLACIIMPVGFVFAVFLLLSVIFRYILVLILWALFPLILALYFSQMAFLARIGGRGINLYIAAILANPVMGIIFKISLDRFNAAADPSTVSWNVADKFLAFIMSLAGFALAGLSPIMLLGVLGNVGAITSMGSVVVGAVTGGAAGAALGGSMSKLEGRFTLPTDRGGDELRFNDPGVKNNIKDAGKNADINLKKSAVHVAAIQDHDADTMRGRLRFMKAVYSDDELLQQYNSLRENGVIRQDNRDRIHVGDGGKQLASKDKRLMEGYSEWSVPYGRGFGDERSRKLAESRGLVSDEKIVMKNTIQGTHDMDGKRYKIAVSDGGDGIYNVAVEGENNMTVLTVNKTPDLQTREEVLERIQEMSNANDETPGKVLAQMYEGYETVEDEEILWKKQGKESK